ncbi:hypothetical protein LLT5_07895 [Lactococcus cremoris subsp. cremoris TIFN5]|nr:hypothetical protein LLT5_07895 [Lactococcus cremoris subsp. cremoris TIFN5]
MDLHVWTTVCSRRLNKVRSQNLIKKYWMNKLKYFGLFILIWTIYWFPDVIFAYPEIFFKSLIGYERQLASTWLLLLIY